MKFSCISDDAQTRSEEARAFPSFNVCNMALQGASLERNDTLNCPN